MSMSHAERATPRVRGASTSQHLRLLRDEPVPSETSIADIEEALLDFDEDAVIAGVVPVPSTIPPAMRNALTRAIHLRFSYLDELDDWLHAAHVALGGASPFERLVDGDGLGVLRALLWPKRRAARRCGPHKSMAGQELRVIR